MAAFLRPAQGDDLAAVVSLMNAAFRGAGEQRGWSTEEGYINGARTSEALLREELRDKVHLLVVDTTVDSQLDGCVSLKSLHLGKWYLGSLAVRPAMQNTGFGRELLAASEEYALSNGALSIEITVVNVRSSLIAWYERRGYHRTGAVRPFPYEDDRFGKPTRSDLSFVVLEKHLS